MKPREVRPAGAVVLLAAACLLVAACGTSTEPSAAEASPDGVATAGPSAPPSAAGESPGQSLPAWSTEPLVDVRTGATIRLADLAGRIVFIEGMATWCPPCLEQQREAELALGRLDQAAVAYVSVDVDPREAEGTLREYVDRHGFQWSFLVGSPAFLRELADSFGSTVLNPPATPIVVLDRAGHGTLTEVGIKRADRLIELARALGA